MTPSIASPHPSPAPASLRDPERQSLSPLLSLLSPAEADNNPQRYVTQDRLQAPPLGHLFKRSTAWETRPKMCELKWLRSSPFQTTPDLDTHIYRANLFTNWTWVNRMIMSHYKWYNLLANAAVWWDQRKWIWWYDATDICIWSHRMWNALRAQTAFDLAKLFHINKALRMEISLCFPDSCYEICRHFRNNSLRFYPHPDGGLIRYAFWTFLEK